MPPTIIELRDSRIVSLREGADGSVEITYRIIDSNTLAAPFLGGIPDWGARLIDLPGFAGPIARYTGFVVSDKRCEFTAGSYNSVDLHVIYSRIQMGNILTPDDGRHTETWDCIAGRERVYTDVDGKPIGNEQEGTDVAVANMRLTMTFLMTRPPVMEIMASVYNSTGFVNSATWRGVPPRNALYLGASCEQVSRYVFRISHQVAIASLGHLPPGWAANAEMGGHDLPYVNIDRNTQWPTIRGASGSYSNTLPPPGFIPYWSKLYQTVSFASIAGGLPESPSE